MPLCCNFVLGVAALIILSAGTGHAQRASQGEPQYTKDGKMILPADYREWIFLSSGLGMTYGPAGRTDAQGHPRFDNVFVSPAAYRSFLRTGRWPDKTVLILEVRGSDSNVSINTSGHVQTGIVGVEAHVKDTARFPGGWAFFGFRNSAAPAKLIPESANCYSCHRSHGAVDSTFVQFYPTLQDAAKKNGTLK